MAGTTPQPHYALPYHNPWAQAQALAQQQQQQAQAPAVAAAPAPSPQQAPQPVPPPPSLLPPEEVRTIFISGLPEDVKDRELQNLLRWLPGYEACQVNFKGEVPMGFALFSNAQLAIAAKDALQDMVFDADSKCVLHTEMAKKNLFVKRDAELSEPSNLSKQPKLRKNKAYSTAEDEALTRAWLAITEDPITAKDHSGGSQWDRICTAFNRFMGCENSDRNANGLACRWVVIHREVKKFCEFLDQVEKTYRNNKTTVDRVNEAKQIYLTMEKAPFKFESSWFMLKGTPKWNDLMLTKTSKKQKPNSDLVNPPLTFDGSINVDIPPSSTPPGFGSQKLNVDVLNPPPTLDESIKVDTPPSSLPTTPVSCPIQLDGDSDPFTLGADQEGIVRTPGRSGVKAKRKNVSNEQTSMVLQEFLNTFQASLQQQHEHNLREAKFREDVAMRELQLREDRARLKHERAREKQYEKDEYIMMMHLGGFSPEQREFWEAKQREIRARWEREGHLQGLKQT